MDVSESRELNLQWFVVRGRVRLANHKLHEAGYFRFTPWEVIYTGHGRTRRRIEVPLFGVYLFVRLDLRIHNWRRLLDVPGVAGVLCNGPLEEEASQPVAVPDSFIDRLVAEGPMTPERVRQLGLKSRQVARAKPLIKAGDTVRLVDDLLGNQLMIVNGVDEKGRASLLMRIMGRLVPVRSHISLLEPMPGAVSPGRSE